MLILFDIDGTLLRTRRPGFDPFEDAGRALHGPAFSMAGVDYAGRLDPDIWRRAAEANGVDDPAGAEAAFRAQYARTFAAGFERGMECFALDGAIELVARVREDPGLTTGVLTGNYPETGRIKLGQAGFDVDGFDVQVWASDGLHRRDLPPVALERWRAAGARTARAEHMVVVGDTPHDVDCARHAGARVIAVGTGPSYGRQELIPLGPDAFVEDLSDVHGIMDTIGQWREAASSPARWGTSE
ncbi:MAG: HAD family hydrolase [Phycisphaerales bacterium]